MAPPATPFEATSCGQSQAFQPSDIEARLRRWGLFEAKLSITEVLSIVVGGVVRASKVQFVGHVGVPPMGILHCRNVTGQLVHEDKEPARRMALGTRMVSGTVFATRSAACVEHKVVGDLASHLFQKQTTSDPCELAQAGHTRTCLSLRTRLSGMVVAGRIVSTSRRAARCEPQHTASD